MNKKIFLFVILGVVLLSFCGRKEARTTPEVLLEVEDLPEPAVLPEDFSPTVPQQVPRITPAQATALEKKIKQEGVKYEYPIEVNDLVKRYIFAYTTKYKKFMEESLTRSGRYIDFIRGVLKQYGIPREIAYLPIIESGYREKARSWMWAKGIWQFMRSTARLYGLSVNWWVDERLDPIRSTYAAARYLRDLYDRFGDWNLALAAYNGGERRVERAIRRSGSRNFWKIKRYLKRQTANYVPAFMATVIIATNPSDYGINFTPLPPFTYDEVEVPSPTDLRVIARCAGVSYSTIRQYNPHILRFTTPGNLKKYRVRLPEGTKERFLSEFSKISSRERLKWTWYRVRRGDSLYRISRKFGVSISAIMQANNMRSTRLRPGRRLLIPLSYAYPRKKHRRGSSYRGRLARAKKKGAIIYTVRRGDTLYGISRRFGVSVRRLKRWNRLRRNLIRPGQKLIIYR